ncbi:TolC family outer membrane protein [Candidatus Sororendozoicomonas aggregata]|uniref:TolC family outer membrane protein n=1 Tax=Candidatus Sororendozoicomonas aggregata TaxID=3073239 RepID=UPI002ED11686
MIRPRHSVFLLAALASSAMSVQAAQPKYNLLDIYNLALENDATLAAAKAGMLAKKELLPQGRAMLLPTISASANTQYQKKTTDVTGGDDQKSNYNSNGWSATLSQPLFNLAGWYGYTQAQSLTTQAEFDFANAQQDLILRVSQAYFNVLRAEDSLITSIAEERAVKQQLDQARERYNVGLIAETDVLQAQAAYDNARVARIEGENQVNVSYENLRTITNASVTDIGKLKKSMPVIKPTPAIAGEWVESALKNNIALKSARAGIKAAEENIKVKKAGHAPTIEATASYNYNNDNSAEGPLEPAGSGYKTGRSDGTVVGLTLTIPIFSGGATQSQVREATYQMEQTQQNFDKLLRDTNANTRNLYHTVSSDVDRVEARQQGIISSESALKATQSGYEVGTQNITDVLDAQQKLYAAQRDYLNARYDFIINTLQLKQYAGTLSPEDLKQLNSWITFNKAESSPSIPVTP